MAHVVAVHSQTKKIGGDESELRGSDSDDADDGAVGAGDDPALPFVFADQVRREQRKSARDVIEAKQINRAHPTTRHRAARRWSRIKVEPSLVSGTPEVGDGNHTKANLLDSSRLYPPR
jgi:hypothetical protein